MVFYNHLGAHNNTDTKLNFDDFHFHHDLLDGLYSMGFETPTPIQAQAIPIILNGDDLIACAQTGTGKTGAFILPIIDKLMHQSSVGINTLIIVPTRELAIQIDEAVQGFSYYGSISVISIFGGNDGMSFEKEKKALTQGADIIIATPGRFISHLNMGYINLKTLKHLVLDEADRMLDMGFSEDLNKIISKLPTDRQTLLFSATMPSKIRVLCNSILKNPKQISLAVSKPAQGVTQQAFVLFEAQKLLLLKKLLQSTEVISILIFSGTKEIVKKLERELLALKLNVAAIHSDLTQERRNEVMRNFKSRQLRILVATDILSRGIDIENIGLVVNYDVPRDAEDYIHRIGRTARAESTGLAITFISEKDQFRFKKIEDLMGNAVQKLPLPEGLGQAPEYNPKAKPPSLQTNKYRTKRKFNANSKSA